MQQTNSKQIGVKRSCSGNNKHSKIGISSQDLERINPDDRQGDGALVRAGKGKSFKPAKLRGWTCLRKCKQRTRRKLEEQNQDKTTTRVALTLGMGLKPERHLHARGVAFPFRLAREKNVNDAVPRQRKITDRGGQSRRMHRDGLLWKRQIAPS